MTLFVLHNFFAGMFFDAFFVITFYAFGSKKPPKMESKSHQNQWTIVSVAISKKVPKIVAKIYAVSLISQEADVLKT